MRDRIPALDGLRALAALAVVAHHTGVPGMAGGWVGVDVFFVLSGYLITGLLLSERDRTGRIRVGAFYLRRAARLYPALLITVAACLLTGMVTTEAGVVSLAYLSDLWIMAGGGLGNALVHTWSLSVEEHFYLLWPAIILALRSRRAVTVAASAGLVASIGVAIAMGPHVLSWQEYVSPHLRGWELLAGCVLAAIPARGRWWAVAAGSAATVAGLTVACVDGWFAEWGRSLPAMVAACGSTVVVLVLVQRDGVVARILSVRVLAWVGRRSYAVYLFHVPGVVVAKIFGFPSISSVPVVLIAAAVSYRWIEVPVQRWMRLRLAQRHRQAGPARVQLRAEEQAIEQRRSALDRLRVLSLDRSGGAEVARHSAESEAEDREWPEQMRLRMWSV